MGTTAIGSASVTNYVVDPESGYGDVVEERDGANSLLARYDYGNGLIRMDRGGTPNYYIADGMGSVRALANASGSLTADAYSYDAYGRQVGSSGSTVNPFQHNGEQSDPTGLYYMRARYYDPATGRFLGVDPNGGAPYQYADDNPVTNSDPTGRETMAEVVLTFTLDSELLNAEFEPVVFNYYKTWDPTFGEVSATINTAGNSDTISLYQVGSGSLDNSVDSQIKNYQNGFIAGLGNSLASAATSLAEITANAAGVAGGPAGMLYKQVFDSFFDPGTLNVLSNPFYATGQGANVGTEQGKVAGMVAQLFIPGVGQEELVADAANIERELPTLENAIKDASDAAGCPINSFVAGTPVQMADGTSRPIEQIKPGEWVLSRNAETLQIEPCQVLDTIEHSDSTIITVTVADEHGEVENLSCTAEHPFYVPGKYWVNAGDLVVGDILVSRSGTLSKVTSVRSQSNEASPTKVFNLTVSGDHSYFVGNLDGGVWAHNVDCPDKELFYLVDENVPKYNRVAYSLRSRGYIAASTKDVFGLGADDTEIVKTMKQVLGDYWRVITRDVHDGDFPAEFSYKVTGGNSTRTDDDVMDILDGYGF